MTKHPDDLLHDVHEHLVLPSSTVNVKLVSGQYSYYHYSCDGINDQCWGCGYRSLQTVCSWIYYQNTQSTRLVTVPSVYEIQNALVIVKDKPSTFLNSKEWIGSVEVGLCIDYFYDVPCKIHHVRQDEHLKDHARVLQEHFSSFGSPVMMGGDVDAASKCILGICETNHSEILVLVLDPHFTSVQNCEELVKKQMLSWRRLDMFDKSSFYNFCLPQLKSSCL